MTMPGGQTKSYGVTLVLALGVAGALMLLRTQWLRASPGNSNPAQWRMLEVNLPNGIVGVAFTSGGEAGAILANNGQVIVSQDGGIHWRKASTPIEESEMHFAPCLAMPTPERVLFGTTVDDDSPYAEVYEVTAAGRKRVVWSGEYGGLLGASHDGQFFVGNNGLLLKIEGNTAHAVRAPACGQVLLYGIAHHESRVIAVGTNGTTLISEDGGRTWICKQIDTNPELHRVAQADNVALVAGAKGALWRYEPSTGSWAKASGTQSWMSVWALYLSPDGKEAYAAGGDVQGNRPFMLHSIDGGRTWGQEPVGNGTSRIMGIGQGRAGIFAVTFDGHVLVRTDF